MPEAARPRMRVEEILLRAPGFHTASVGSGGSLQSEHNPLHPYPAQGWLRTRGDAAASIGGAGEIESKEDARSLQQGLGSDVAEFICGAVPATVLNIVPGCTPRQGVPSPFGVEITRPPTRRPKKG